MYVLYVCIYKSTMILAMIFCWFRQQWFSMLSTTGYREYSKAYFMMASITSGMYIHMYVCMYVYRNSFLNFVNPVFYLYINVCVMYAFYMYA